MSGNAFGYLMRETAFRCHRILKPAGSLLVFCDWRMLSMLSPHIESTGWRFQNLVVWDKGSIGLGTGFRPRHELVLHFTHGPARYAVKNGGNVIQAKRTKNANHPTEKPVDLLAELLRVACPEGGTVFDPFMGSGSTGVAAIETGRKFVGGEFDDQWLDTAKERITQASQ